MAKLSTYLNGLTEDTTPDTANDMLLEYDASATASKKLKLSTLIALATGGGLAVDGWAAADAMTYASADAPTFTMTCAGDHTAKYYPGMRVKLTQTSVKYFIITAVAYSTSTTITLYGGTDYTLANAAITSPYYASAKAPAGFPLDPTKWTVRVTDTTQRSQASPGAGTWYNLGGVTISIPIGIWRVSYEVAIHVAKAAASSGYSTLSTANNSQSDVDLTTFVADGANAAYMTVYRAKTLALAAKTAYYLNTMTDTGSVPTIYNRNELSTAIIEAACVYL